MHCARDITEPLPTLGIDAEFNWPQQGPEPLHPFVQSLRLNNP
jgi:hypothetical protein